MLILMDNGATIWTYTELPLGLPQSLDRALVWVDSVESVSKHPRRHFDKRLMQIMDLVRLNEYWSG